MNAGEFANIGELLEHQAERYGDKPFLFVENDGRVFTYRQFNDEVNRVTALFATLGVTKGDRISLYLTNSAEYLIAYFACFKLGAWAGPVNALLKPQEIEFIVSNSEASLVVTQADLYPNLAEVRDRLPLVQHVVGAGGRGPEAGEEGAMSGSQWPVWEQWSVVSGQEQWPVVSGRWPVNS